MKKSIIGILVCMLFIFSGFSIATASIENTPPNVPSDPHPADGAVDVGKKTHLSWTGGDPDPGDKAIYDVYFAIDVNPGLIASDLQMPNYKPDTLDNFTQYYWYVVAKDENGASTIGHLWTFTTNDCYCDPPEKPSGPSRVRNRQRYDYSTKIMNQNQDGWYYNFSWGDGNYSGWLGPYNHNERVRVENQWEEPGTYQVQTRARFQNNIRNEEWIITGWSEPLIVTVSTNDPDNNPPNKPSLNGPTSGTPGVEYPFTFSTIDPDGDDVYYVVSWGFVCSDTHTYGPYKSGETVEISHGWPEKGRYTITAIAMDVYESESDTATLTIIMPRNRAMNTPFLNFLQNHPNLFPILTFLLQRFGIQ